MAGNRDPRDTPAGMPKDALRMRPPDKQNAKPVYAFSGNDEIPPCNVVLVRKSGKTTWRVRRLDMDDFEFIAKLSELTPPEGTTKPAEG
jgi:hypothetical protein